jgi:hypothetical protein
MWNHRLQAMPDSMNQKANFYIGWDVSGWNCDRNKGSRDVFVRVMQQKPVLEARNRCDRIE